MKNKTNDAKTDFKPNKNIRVLFKKNILSIKKLGETKNHVGVNTTTIIWVVILVGIVVSLAALKLISNYEEKVNSIQTSLVNTIYDKFSVFSKENDQIKNTKQSFVEVLKNKKFNKTNEVLNKLLDEAQKIQPKIDELKSISKLDVNLANGIKYKAIFDDYYKASDLQDRDNKTLIEMIKLGLKMNWKNPTQEQVTKWRNLAIESGTIDNAIKNVQAEIQNNLSKK
ncbi:MAG: hypothetical protein WCI91_03145 [Candidatus Nomurabacteria bacterium]